MNTTVWTTNFQQHKNKHNCLHNKL